MSRKRTARPKLSVTQFIKGSIIRMGLAKKVKVRDDKPAEDGSRGARIQFQFIWRRVALFFVVLMALGWISLATGGYVFVKKVRKFPEVRFVDVAFPHRWDQYHVSLGDYYIKQAKELMEEGELGAGLHLLRVGVPKSPDNTEGRLMLAQIYNAIGRPDRGIELLQARVNEHAADTAYLSALISLLFANHEDAAVEELADRFLADSTEPTERNLALALAAATANFNRGNYDRAEEMIEKYELLKTRTGTILKARVCWDLGDSEQAISLLEKVLDDPGTLEAQVVDYLIEYLWSSGDQDRAQRVALERFIGNPLSFAPRVRLLHIYHKRGDAAKEAKETQTYIELFGEDQDAMNALAEFAAKSKNSELAETVYQHVLARGLASEWTAIFLLEAHVGAGNFRVAQTFYETIEKAATEWTPLQKARLQPIVAAVYLGAGDIERGDVILHEMLVLMQNNYPADLMVLAERLIEMERFTRARDVLSNVHDRQPLNQEALTRLIDLDLKTGNNSEIVPNLERLLKMRKPSVVVLENAHSHISSDRFLFQAHRKAALESLEAVLVTGRSGDS